MDPLWEGSFAWHFTGVSHRSQNSNISCFNPLQCIHIIMGCFPKLTRHSRRPRPRRLALRVTEPYDKWPVSQPVSISAAGKAPPFRACPFQFSSNQPTPSFLRCSPLSPSIVTDGRGRRRCCRARSSSQFLNLGHSCSYVFLPRVPQTRLVRYPSVCILPDS